MFARFEGTEGGWWDEWFEEVWDSDVREFGEKEGEDVGWLRYVDRGEGGSGGRAVSWFTGKLS